MKGHPDIIKSLNEVLTSELTGINQYFIHHRMCASWGYGRLSDHSRAESIGEMKHADAVIERILYLEGIPNMQRLSKVAVGETVPEQLRLDLALEIEAVDRLNRAVILCREHGDNGTRELLERILVSEEEHVDWLETQLELIDQVGEANYLAQQIYPGA
jgi:bacterioferritin